MEALNSKTITRIVGISYETRDLALEIGASYTDNTGYDEDIYTAASLLYSAKEMLDEDDCDLTELRVCIEELERLTAYCRENDYHLITFA
jgi:hypothetical protein